MFIRRKASRQGTTSAGNAVWMAVAAVVAGVLGWSAAAGAQTTPNAVIVHSSVITNVNGNAGHIATNSAGDLFYVSQTDNTAYWLKHGTTTPVALVTGLSGGRSVSVDPTTNNVYVPSNYSGVIIEVPYQNGSYATNVARTSLTSCNSATVTAPCLAFGNGAGALAYYYQPTDVQFDAAGNAYMIDVWSNTYSGGSNMVNSIVEWKTAPTVKNCTAATGYCAFVVATGITPHTHNAQLAVDKAGNIFYADGTNAYYVAAGTAASVVSGQTPVSQPTKFGSFTNPTGVSVDQFGNVYVTNSSAPNGIYEFPAVNGSAIIATNTQPPAYSITNGFLLDATYSANGVAWDPQGEMYYTGYANNSTNLNVATFNTAALGSAAVGTAVSSTATPLTVQFITNNTIGAINLVGAGAGFSYTAGTCAVGTAYTAGQSCTINVNYKPNAVGLQRGAVVLTTASNAVIAETELSGIGLGAAQTNDPGTPSAFGSGFKSPMAIAVDSSKNVFVADTGNNAVEEYAGGGSTGTSIGSGLSKPTSVAVDNAGNVYIGDGGNGRVVEVPNVNGALTTASQQVVLSGLGSTIGLTADLYGNLYVADTNKGKVYELRPINGVPSTSAQTTVALPAAVAPFAMTTDTTGNLFVADLSANTITEVLFYGGTTQNIGNGYSHPSGLATDGSNSLYVADPGNLRLIKIPFENPIYNTNDQYSVGPQFTVAQGVTVPYAVALDPAFNLYVVDNQNSKVTFLNRAQGTLNLGSSNVGATTAQQNAEIGNAGNQALNLGNPAYTTTALPVFNLTSPANAGCANSTTLQPSFACALQATFNPAATTNYTEVLAFTSNAANTAGPSLALVGTGANLATDTVTLKQTAPAGTAAFGQTVTIQATISSPTAGTPSGYMLFYVDGNFNSVQPVTGPTVSVNVNGLLGGTHTVAATYTGDATFASNNTTLTITVVKAGSTVNVNATLGTFANPLSALPNTPVTLIATVVPNASTVPTGNVVFSQGGVTLGTAPVVPNGSGGGYSATIVSPLPLGNINVIATYTGDVNYATSVGSLAIIVSLQTFTITPAQQTVTVSTAGTVTAHLQFLSIAGFGKAEVALRCDGLPANSECGFDPNGFLIQPNNQLTAEQRDANNKVVVAATYGPMNVTMTIITGTTPPVAAPLVKHGAVHVAGINRDVPVSLALLGLTPFALLLGRRRARKLSKALTLVLLLGVSLFTFSGCGSNLVGITPKGTYDVTVTATATTQAYTGALAAGCILTPPAGSPVPATLPTCSQTAHVSLVVQ